MVDKRERAADLLAAVAAEISDRLPDGVTVRVSRDGGRTTVSRIDDAAEWAGRF